MPQLFYKPNKPLKEKPGHFINVASNLEIKDLKKRGFKYFKYEGLSLCGTQEAIDEFFSLNDIDEGYKFIDAENDDDQLSDFELEYEENKRERTNIKDDNIVIPNLRREVITQGIVKSGLNNTDIREDSPEFSVMRVPTMANITPDTMKRLCPFELTNLKCTAKLYQLTAMNNIELAVEIKLIDLATERPKGKNKDMKSPIITAQPDTTFITLFNCRLFDLETADKDTVQGQICTLLLEDYIRNTLESIVYIEIKGFENGKMLIKMCTDKNHKSGIDKKLENVRIEEIVNLLTDAGISWDKEVFTDEHDLEFIAQPSQKDNNIKNYPRVDKNFITRINHGELLSKYALI
jgi:hypothetical protein